MIDDFLKNQRTRLQQASRYTFMTPQQVMTDVYKRINLLRNAPRPRLHTEYLQQWMREARNMIRPQQAPAAPRSPGPQRLIQQERRTKNQARKRRRE
jgi:hypothetical protein